MANPTVPAPKIPTITSANVPQTIPEGAKPPVVDGAAAEAFIPDEQIEARPLTMPDFINIKPKNPNHSLRWVVFKVGKDESSLRYEQALAQGFRNATVDDVQKVSPAYIRDGGKRLVNGDVILMLHSRQAYVGALKRKDEQAKNLAAKTEGVRRAQQGVDDILKGQPADVQGKVRVFTPSKDEIEGLVGKDD